MIFNSIKNEKIDYQCLDQIGHQTSDLYLCYCGIEFCPPDHIYGPTIRSEYLLHFIFSGKGYFKIQGKTYELKKGQAFLIPPGIETVYHADPKAPYAYTWVAFDGDKAALYVEQASLSAEHPVCNLTVPMEQFRELTDLIIGAKELTISNEIKRVGYLYHILAKLIASNQKKSTGPIPLNYPAETYAQYALQYIELNCNHINVTDIVNHVGIDRSYLYTVFKRYYHVSPQEYLISFRLRKAAELLTQTAHPIVHIARETGYGDALTFSKAFKKHYGISPKFYRQQHSRQEIL